MELNDDIEALIDLLAPSNWAPPAREASNP